MSDDTLGLDFPKGKKAGPGPVYQGVCKTIAKLVDLDVVDKERHAGLIAQARSLAGSIDRDSGRDPSRKQASGVSLAALHERLADILERLDPAAAAETDAFDQLLEELGAQ